MSSNVIDRNLKSLEGKSTSKGYKLGLKSNKRGVSRRGLLNLGAAITAGTGAAILGSFPGTVAQAATDIATPLTTSPSVDGAVFSARRRGVPIRGWEDISSWSTNNGSGTLTAESGDPDQPRRIKLVSAAGVPATTSIRTTFTIRKGGGIAIRIKRDANAQVVRLTLVTGPYSRPKSFRTDTGTGPVPVGQWYDMVIPAAFLARYSDWGADMNWCTEIQLTIIPVDGKSATLEIAEPRVIQGDGIPRVIWAFDDGRADQYSLAYPILAAAGYVGTIAVEHNTVGAPNRCTLSQYQELYANGWEFIAHHTAQIPPLSDDAAEAIFRAAREWAQSNGFVRGISHWVWPGGLWDTQKDKIASRYFLTRRKVSPMINCITPGVYDPCDPPVYYITQTRPLPDAKAYIDRAVAYGNTIHFAFHTLTSGIPSAPEDWTVSDFQALVSYAKSKGLVSTSYDEAFGISG